jgi:hypothetical protein
MKRQKQTRCPVCGEVHARLGLEIEGDVMRRTVTDCAGQMLQIGGGAWAYKAHIIAAHAEVKRYEVIAGDVCYVADCETMQSKGITQTLSAAYGPQKILFLKYWQIERGAQIAKPKPKRTRRAQRAQELRENVHGLQLSQMGFAGLGWRVRL